MGILTGGGTYKYGSSVTIKADPNSGYSFTGWYLNDELVSSNSEYTLTMPNDNAIYVAKFEPVSRVLTCESENEAEGTVTGSGTYKYKSTVTISAFPKEGYSFVGWYSSGKYLVSEEPTYTFLMPMVNITYVAKFSANQVKLNLTSENTEKGTVDGSGVYSTGSWVDIKAVPNPYTFTKSTFLGWYDGETLVSTNSNYGFYMPGHDLNYVAKFGDEIDKTKGDKILFGSYPQSKVTDSETLNLLSEYETYLKSDDNNFLRTEFNWSGEGIDSNAWYLDVDLNNDNLFDYRGVYFTSYRPSTHQEENKYIKSNVYWFNYDPIEWEILSNDEQGIKVIASKIIDGQQFSSTDSTEMSLRQDYQGYEEMSYSNNYQFSELRSFLNVDFYNSAFNNSNKDKILTKTVNNSKSSIGYSDSTYCCNNTNDKVQLLSCSESNDFVSGSRRKVVTDYGICMGLDSSWPSWWLRSPASLSNTSNYIDYDGISTQAFSSDLLESSCTNVRGLVPVIYLQSHFN